MALEAMSGCRRSIMLLAALSALFLQGCDGASAIRQLNILAICIAVCCMLGSCMGWCYALHKPPGQFNCNMLKMCLPPFLMCIVGWVAVGLMTSAMNCESFKSMDPDRCEWLDPLPVAGFRESECCVEAANEDPE